MMGWGGAVCEVGVRCWIEKGGEKRKRDVEKEGGGVGLREKRNVKKERKRLK